MERGYPTKVLGERREVPERGPTNLVHFDALRRPLVAKRPGIF